MLNYEKIKEDFVYPDAKTIDFMGEQLFIKQFLPLEDKYGIIYLCLMSLNLEEQCYNPLLGEALFEIELVKTYTNINFENVDDSYFKQFDTLHCSGLIDLVIANIPKEEYEELQRLYEESIKHSIDYNSSIGHSITGLFSNLPNLNTELEEIDTEKLEKGLEIVEKLSKDKHI